MCVLITHSSCCDGPAEEAELYRKYRKDQHYSAMEMCLSCVHMPHRGGQQLRIVKTSGGDTCGSGGISYTDIEGQPCTGKEEISGKHTASLVVSIGLYYGLWGL